MTDTPKRPETTLVLASSVDGRLTGGDSVDLDADKTWKLKEGVRGYLQQSYGLTSEEGVFNLITGKVLANTGVNHRSAKPHKENIRLIVLDHYRDLTPEGISYLSECVKKLILVCGKVHPIIKLKNKPKNLTIFTQPRLNRPLLLAEFAKMNIQKITIQSSGRLNAKWVNDGLVDYLTVIVYPLLVGNSGTPVLENKKLSIVRPLRLIDTKPFNFNYIALNYQVLND